MVTTRMIASVCLTLCALGGCSGVRSIQDPVAQFDRDADKAASDEAGFLNAVKTIDCDSQFYSATRNWAVEGGAPPDIGGSCRPTILSDRQIQARIDAMQLVAQYADRLKALAAGTDGASLDASAVKAAQAANAIGKDAGLSNPAVAAAVESAIVALGDMLMDQKRFTDSEAAAASAEPALKTLADTLKTENTVLAEAFQSRLDKVDVTLANLLVQDHGPQGLPGFLDALEARRIMQAVNPLASAASPSGGDPAATADSLNKTLDALVAENAAIANHGSGGPMDMAGDLAARAKAAEADDATLAK